MTGPTKETLVVLSFFAVTLSLTIAETAWLNKKNWAGLGKSLAFAAATNFVGFSVGLFVLYIVIVVNIAMAFNGTLRYHPYQNTIILASIIFGIFSVPLVLMLGKRLFLRILKMKAGKPAWIFSLASAILLSLISLGMPSLLAYLPI